MKRRIAAFARANGKVLLVAGLVACVTGAGGAVAAKKLIKSKQIKDGTIKLKDLNPQVQDLVNQGRSGTPGSTGTPGADAEFNASNWGIINRNHIGSAVADLRDGPHGSFSATSNIDPPFGDGSLQISVSDNAVADPPGTNGPLQEKAAFGNEVDFLGDPMLDVDEVGFHVFQTGENANIAARNLPNITFEIDSNIETAGAGTVDDYTSLTFVPDAVTISGGGSWSGYIDATSSGNWYFSGGEGTRTGCTVSLTCDFDDVMTALDEAGPGDTDPIIYTFGVAKGRDNAYAGAVDGLRLNGTVFDFEPLGVFETTP
jgi:hypothetical protein